MLKKFAPYSRDTILSFGTGGSLPHFNGFKFLYHGFFSFGCTILLVSVVNVDVVVACVVVLCAARRVFFSSESEPDLDLPLSPDVDSTYFSGSVATGSEVVVT